MVTHQGVRYLITARGMFPLPPDHGQGMPPVAATMSALATPRGHGLVPVDFDVLKKSMDKSEDAEARKEGFDIQAELKKISDKLQQMPGAPQRKRA